MSNFLTRFRRRASPNIPQSNVTNEQQTATPNYKIRVEMLQLAIFIAMPSPDKSHRKKQNLENNDPDPDEESHDKLPEVAIGVARVNYRQPKSVPSPTLPPLQPKLT